MPTGFIAQGGRPYVYSQLVGASGQVQNTYNCNPGPSACDAVGNIAGDPMSVSFVCVEWTITPEMLDTADGGSVTISTSTVGFFSTACKYLAASVYVTYDLRGIGQHPTRAPTPIPTASPTPVPTIAPSTNPTAQPTVRPTFSPSFAPSAAPTSKPSVEPTAHPSSIPTARPTPSPSLKPTNFPTRMPTPGPTPEPSAVPTQSPSMFPTYAAGSVLAPVFRGDCSDSQTTKTSCQVSHTFTHLYAPDQVKTWFLEVWVWSTGLGATGVQNAVTVALSVQGVQFDVRRCNPGNGCGSQQPPQPVLCAVNIPIPASKLNPREVGGSFTVSTTNTALSPDHCYADGASVGLHSNNNGTRLLQDDTKGYALLVRYSLTTGSVPTAAPSAQPTPAPTPIGTAFSFSLGSQSSAVTEVLMNKGAPLYIVGAFAAVFAIIGVLAVKSKDQRVDLDSESKADIDKKLAGGRVYSGLGLLATAFGLALVGSSFISECFLIQMYLSSARFQYLGFLTVLGRIANVAVAVYLLVKINSADSPLHRLMNNTMRTGQKIFSAMSLLCLLDVTLIPCLPWLHSGFAENTRGYPTRQVFLLCVYSKIAQTMATLSCQAIYLEHALRVATTLPSMPTSVAFLGLNIAITGLLFIVNLIEAANKTSLLQEWEKQDKRALKRGSQGQAGSHAREHNPMHHHSGRETRDMELELAAYVAYPPEDVTEHVRGMSIERAGSFSNSQRGSLGGTDGSGGSGARLSQQYFGHEQALPSASTLAARPALLPPVPRTRSMVLTRDSIPSAPRVSRLVLANLPTSGSPLSFRMSDQGQPGPPQSPAHVTPS